MEPWLKTGRGAATEIMAIIVHIVKRATDTKIIAGTGTTVIGRIMATWKKIVRMVIESIHNPGHLENMTPS